MVKSFIQKGPRGDFKSILFCTTTGYFLPLFPPKKREEEKVNEVAEPVLNHFFSG